jgi:hypothetical protein
MRPNFKCIEMSGLSLIKEKHYFTISMHLKSGLIRWVASLKGDNLLVFYYLRPQNIPTPPITT